MTDKELLELAAKADGFTHVQYADSEGLMVGIIPGSWGSVKYWNPLTVDGDAFRLAMGLRMKIDMSGPDIQVLWATPVDGNYCDNQRLNIVEPVYSIGIQNATRRAIVRAAAEIGKGMK